MNKHSSRQARHTPRCLIGPTSTGSHPLCLTPPRAIMMEKLLPRSCSPRGQLFSLLFFFRRLCAIIDAAIGFHGELSFTDTGFHGGAAVPCTVFHLAGEGPLAALEDAWPELGFRRHVLMHPLEKIIPISLKRISASSYSPRSSWLIPLSDRSRSKRFADTSRKR